MSVYTLKLPFFQRSPRVWDDDNNLFARTSLWYQFLNLGSYCRTVHVSKTRRQITIKIRKFWFFTKSTIIRFDNIDYIDRSHWDSPDSFGLDTDGLCVTDVTEVWYVRIFTKDSALPINIFRFLGEGSRLTGWRRSI